MLVDFRSWCLDQSSSALNIQVVGKLKSCSFSSRAKTAGGNALLAPVWGRRQATLCRANQAPREEWNVAAAIVPQTPQQYSHRNPRHSKSLETFSETPPAGGTLLDMQAVGSATGSSNWS